MVILDTSTGSNPQQPCVDSSLMNYNKVYIKLNNESQEIAKVKQIMYSMTAADMGFELQNSLRSYRETEWSRIRVTVNPTVSNFDCFFSHNL